MGAGSKVKGVKLIKCYRRIRLSKPVKKQLLFKKYCSFLGSLNHAKIAASLLEKPRLEEQMENLQQLALHSWWGGGEVKRL